MKDHLRRRRLKEFGRALEKAIQARDLERYLELLEEQEIKEGSDEWKRALEHFRNWTSYL